MNHHVSDYFSEFRDDSPKGNFHKVITLEKNPHLKWEDITKMVPKMSKGWYELAHLNSDYRIEFTCDFWLSKLPYHPPLDTFLTRFFATLSDINFFITQRTFDDPFEAHMIYSLQGDVGFFKGSLPASGQEINKIQNDFSGMILPKDYLSFLQIHNGFSKATDSTGLIPTNLLLSSFDSFQKMINQEGPITTSRGKAVNPKMLIPFYESFGMPFYQCFWAEWYPENEMGNVYYSSTTKTIFDVESSDPSSESMAFPTFLDWLMFYMERIE